MRKGKRKPAQVAPVATDVADVAKVAAPILEIHSLDMEARG
jgi:23S rRNA (uracil1939-C5)-methyltransferase